MDGNHDSFQGETGALEGRAPRTLAEELKITRWWLERLKTMVAAEVPKAPDVLLGALNEFRDHLRKCYSLEEQEGLHSEGDFESPTLEREERRLLDEHQKITGRLEVLLNDLRVHPEEHPQETLESLKQFLADCQDLDLEETHFVQRSAYAEYGVGD